MLLAFTLRLGLSIVIVPTRRIRSSSAPATRRSTTGRHERFRDQIPERRFVVPRYYSHNFCEPRSRRGEITYKRGSTDFETCVLARPCTRPFATCTRRASVRVTLIKRNEADLSLAYGREIRRISSRNEKLPC